MSIIVKDWSYLLFASRFTDALAGHVVDNTLTVPIDNLVVDHKWLDMEPTGPDTGKFISRATLSRDPCNGSEWDEVLTHLDTYCPIYVEHQGFSVTHIRRHISADALSVTYEVHLKLRNA